MTTAQPRVQASGQVEAEPQVDLIEEMTEAGSTRAMVVMAHPDDNEFACGGTVAHLAKLGWDVHIVVTTSGNKGTKDIAITAQHLAATREEEQRRAGGDPRSGRAHVLRLPRRLHREHERAARADRPPAPDSPAEPRDHLGRLSSRLQPSRSPADRSRDVRRDLPGRRRPPLLPGRQGRGPRAVSPARPAAHRARTSPTTTST